MGEKEEQWINEQKIYEENQITLESTYQSLKEQMDALMKKHDEEKIFTEAEIERLKLEIIENQEAMEMQAHGLNESHMKERQLLAAELNERLQELEDSFVE